MEYKVAITDEQNVLDKLTQIMRDADKAFETIGGGTRHYLRDVFLPLLHQEGLSICTVNKHEANQKVLVTVFADEDTRKTMVDPETEAKLNELQG